jgi:hypothetical protein
MSQDFDLCDACYTAGYEVDVPPHAPDHELVRLPIAPPPDVASGGPAHVPIPALAPVAADASSSGGRAAEGDAAPSTVADSEGEDDVMLAMAVAMSLGSEAPNKAGGAADVAADAAAKAEPPKAGAQPPTVKMSTIVFELMVGGLSQARAIPPQACAPACPRHSPNAPPDPPSRVRGHRSRVSTV